jgi:LPS sulfotransferase NodH
VLAGKVLFSGRAIQGSRRNVPPISPEEVAEARIFFPTQKFFIFGHARSGTTLLTRLIRLHPKVHCNYQAHFFTRAPLLESLVADPEVESWLSRHSNRWNRGRDLSPVILRAVSDFILEREARRVGKFGSDCMVGDKSPNNLLNGLAVDLLVKIYPDARLIFIVRDGRDAVLSHRFQSFIDTPQHLSQADSLIRQSFVQNPEPYLSGQLSLFSEKSLVQEAERWVRNVQDTDQTATSRLGDHYIHLQYEDLLDNPWNEMSRLWEFLGLAPGVSGLPEALDEELTQNPDADWQREKAGEIAMHIQKGKRHSWREILTERDRDIFAREAGPILEAWGYEVG